MRSPMPSVNLSRRARIALSVVGLLVVLVIVLAKFAGVYINYLWFQEVGHRNVYSTIIWTRAILFLIFGVLMALIIGGNLALAYRLRPPFRPMSPEQQNLQHYVLMVEPRRKLILAGVMIIALLAAGASAQGDWMTWQLWLHGGSFGQRDAQFNLDIGFYAWDYPTYRLMLGFGFTAVIFTLLLVVGIHYLTGAIRLQTPGPKITLSARRHITVLLFVFMALKAAAYWLDRYGFVFSSRSKFTGASYTDVHAALPAKTFLFYIAILLALGVLASIWLRSALLPGIGFIVLIVLSILASGVFPAILQSVSVSPNASDKERPYIERNITATRQAYGIVTNNKANPNGTVTYKGYPGDPTPSPSALSNSDATVANLRILDPNVLSPTFAQQQAQQKNFYGLPSKLDVDRYTVKGVTRDYIVGVRELSAARLSGTQSNWINQHTNYTHGYGFVAAAADSDVTSSNSYADGDIPPSGPLNQAVPLTTPQEYYGELVSNYAIVGAKGAPREFDGDGSKKVTYAGKGGISLSNPLTRLAFAADDGETNFLLNDAVSSPGARILINRDPRQRVEKVAPFLKADGDPYPIVDSQTGHIVWMVDAYTTISNYPYSELNDLSDLTSDSLTASKRAAGQPSSQINYIRNSVKATVDAYDGTVHLYQWDTEDPVLKAWMHVFPKLVSAKSSMPASIRAHVRYPEDLFSVQRQLLEQYHVDQPVTFYNGSDKWTVPKDPAPGASGDQPPYYVIADSQDGSGSDFQLTSPMKVNNKSNLAAYITADSDPANYGKLTVLRLGSGSIIDGPEQVANSFYGTDVVSRDLSLFDSGSSAVRYGNLLTLPVGKGFLYVEPLYVQASSNGFPILKRVLVKFGGTAGSASNGIGYGATLQDALNDVRLGRKTGSTTSNTTSTGTGSTPTGTPTSSAPTSVAPSSGSTSTSAPTTLAGLVAALTSAKSQLDAALRSGDQVAIAKAQVREQTLVELLLSQQAGSTRPTSKATGASSSRSP